MALRIVEESGNITELKSTVVISGEGGFTLSATVGSGEVFLRYLPPIFADIDPSLYLVFLLSRSSFSENDIFTVFSKAEDKRIGFIFPLQTMRSLEHKFAGDRSFLRFSQAAFMQLCQGIDGCYCKVPTVVGDAELDIFDFYSEDSIVLILYKPALGALEFNINSYLPCLFKYGYFLQTSGVDPSTSVGVLDEPYSELGAKLSIRPISESFTQAAFVTHAMRKTLPYESNPLLIFFYQYQLIELLIGQILDTSFQEFKEQLAADAAIASSIRDTVKTLNENMNEKVRLKRLFNRHIGTNPELSALRLKCNEFLNANGVTLKKEIAVQSFADYLYETRNVLFHNLRNVAPESLELVGEINGLLRPVLCDMLVNYVPKPSEGLADLPLPEVEVAAS